MTRRTRDRPRFDATFMSRANTTNLCLTNSREQCDGHGANSVPARDRACVAQDIQAFSDINQYNKSIDSPSLPTTFVVEVLPIPELFGIQ